MALVTIRILEGLERGRSYSGLPTPITIGREDDNDIQLNDDRVSRFHAKLQDDGGNVILTDLDSTNGTRVNGHPVQVKVLQVGDLVTIGRCVLAFGPLPGWEPTSDGSAGRGTAILHDDADALASHEDGFLEGLTSAGDRPEPLFPRGAPSLPDDLKLVHRAQLSDILAFAHEQVGQVLMTAYENPEHRSGSREMICPPESWNVLVSLQATLAQYLARIATPD